MKYRPQTCMLKDVSPQNVRAWFEDAWPEQPKYPTETQCSSVSSRINVVVISHNAELRRKPSPKQLSDIHNLYVNARKHARALRRLLPSLSQDLELRSYAYFQNNALLAWQSERWRMVLAPCLRFPLRLKRGSTKIITDGSPTQPPAHGWGAACNSGEETGPQTRSWRLSAWRSNIPASSLKMGRA